MKRTIELDNIIFAIWNETVDKFERVREDGTCYMECKEKTFKQYLTDLTFREMSYYLDTIKADLMAECEDIEFWESISNWDGAKK